jgi:hypothetical protein
MAHTWGSVTGPAFWLLFSSAATFCFPDPAGFLTVSRRRWWAPAARFNVGLQTWPFAGAVSAAVEGRRSGRWGMFCTLRRTRRHVPPSVGDCVKVPDVDDCSRSPTANLRAKKIQFDNAPSL